MRITFLLLHDFKFASWTVDDFLSRYHFSKEYAKRLAKKGHEVRLITMHQDIDKPETFEKEGYHLEIHPVERRFPPFLRFGNCHSRTVLDSAKQTVPDIVHIHNYYLWGAMAAIAITKRLGAKVIGQYHGEPDKLLKFRALKKGPYDLVDMYLVPTKGEFYKLRNTFSLDQDRIRLLPNVGVDTSLFRNCQNKMDDPTLIYVGRLANEAKGKNPLLIIEMLRILAKDLPSIKMVFVGDGPAELLLRGFITKYGLSSNTSFLGYISNIDIPCLISRAWASINPMLLDDFDIYWDGFTKESLSCETPTFGFSSKGTALIREFGGLLPREPKRAARQLLDLLSNKEMLTTMGKAGRRAILDCCSWDKVIGRLEGIYHDVLNP